MINEVPKPRKKCRTEVYWVFVQTRYQFHNFLNIQTSLGDLFDETIEERDDRSNIFRLTMNNGGSEILQPQII